VHNHFLSLRKIITAGSFLVKFFEALQFSMPAEVFSRFVTFFMQHRDSSGNPHLTA
jgi:hypothetical protein